MGIEIERKFLIDSAIIETLNNGQSIQQGYVPTRQNTTVRIRIKGATAFLTLKGESLGASCSEFEYAIPVSDAKAMLGEFCTGTLVEKTRYEIVDGDHLWEIDVFSGHNEGLVVAEVELKHEGEHVNLPAWVREEVTGDPRYYNSNLLDYPYKEWD